VTRFLSVPIVASQLLCGANHERTLCAFVRDREYAAGVTMRELDAIGEPEQRRSAVEELAGFVLGIVRAYVWFVILLFVAVPILG
jgi:hypothetical protein